MKCKLCDIKLEIYQPGSGHEWLLYCRECGLLYRNVKFLHTSHYYDSLPMAFK